jgi:transcriptional regulator GlxA family with amidase domain
MADEIDSRNLCDTIKQNKKEIQSSMKIAILTFDRFTDLDVFLPWDILKRVNEFFPHLDWDVKIVGTAPYHTSFAGLTIPTMADLTYLEHADAVLIASGPGVQRLIRDEAYLKQLKQRLNPERQLIGSMCSGALLLAEIGLLKNRKATTYATRLKQLASYGIEAVEEPFVRVGNVATAAGCLAAITLARWFIESLASVDIADKCIASIQPNGAPLELPRA